MQHRRCARAAFTAALTSLLAATALAATPTTPGEDAEHEAIGAWRRQRVESLTSDGGWLTLAGLFWLKPGSNSFGRAPGNDALLDNPSVAPRAGSFELTNDKVRFVALPGSGVTHSGRAVT